MKSGFACYTYMHWKTNGTQSYNMVTTKYIRQLYQDQVICLYHNNMHKWYTVHYLIISGMNLAI